MPEVQGMSQCQRLSHHLEGFLYAYQNAIFLFLKFRMVAGRRRDQGK